MPPRKPVEQQHRHTSTRLTRDLREKIERSAAQSGRSLTQEIEWRLVQSYAWEETFQDTRTYYAAKKAEMDEAVRSTARVNEVRARQQAEGSVTWVDPALPLPKPLIDALRMVVREELAAQEAPRKRA